MTEEAVFDGALGDAALFEEVPEEDFFSHEKVFSEVSVFLDAAGAAGFAAVTVCFRDSFESLLLTDKTFTATQTQIIRNRIPKKG